MGNRHSLDNEIFNLKFNAKQLKRMSQKCAKEEKSEQKKIQKALEKKQQDIARIHAENAIRQKNQKINFLRLASRMEAVVQRMQSAQAIKNLNKSMIGVTKAISKAVNSMNIEKITSTMDQFEKNFEELDIQSSVMESAVEQTTGTVMPEEEVDGLMQKVADANNLEFQRDLDIVVPTGTQSLENEENDLEKRFNELKNT